MAIDYSKFDKMVNLDELKNDLKDVEENGGTGDYPEVPHGEYEVKVAKLELTETGANSKNPGSPMVTAWFKVLSGQHKDGMIFMNQVIMQPFQIHLAKKFLESLESGLAIEFESYSQFGQLLMDVHEAIDNNLEYALKYGENNKGYNTFEITEVYEVI